MKEMTGVPDTVVGTAPSHATGHPTNGHGGAVTGDGGGPPNPAGDQGEPKGSVVHLVAVIAAILAVSLLTHSLDLLLVIVAIIVMVMIHELGHFATAKWSHMKVTEYFLGFGPRLWSFRRGETEYGVKALPLGGYVKILGMTNTEEVDPADEPRTYRQQPFHNRLMVAVAGSFMHFVMAFVLVWGLLVIIGQQEPSTSVAGFSAVSHGVDPALTSGLRTGDRIVSIDGRAVTNVTQLEDVIGHHAGVPLTMVVDRGPSATPVTITVTPAAVPGGPKDSARIGILLGTSTARSSPWHAVTTTGDFIGEITTGTLAALGHTFSPHGLTAFFSQLGNTKAADAAAKNGSRPESIYGAVRTATEVAQGGGFFDLGQVLANIIIAVGIINLFPMLPLDGGHVLVAVYERVRSRKGKLYHADVTKLMPVASAFVLFLIIFVAAAVFLDVAHPIANPFQ
jgi:membrane-associated protease RseP (regulator of RpoE activity)